MGGLSMRAAGRLLGITGTDIADLAAVGLLPQPARQGNRLTIPEEAIAALQPEACPPAPQHLPAVVVRMGPPAINEDEFDDRKFVGLTLRNYPDANEEESEVHRRAAVGRWWPIANSETLAGLPLVATAARGYVAAVYRIDPDSRPVSQFGRLAFELVDADEATAGLYLGHTLKLPPGPIALRLPR